MTVYLGKKPKPRKTRNPIFRPVPLPPRPVREPQARVRDTGLPAVTNSRVYGGNKGSVVLYDVSFGAQVAPGTMKYMEDVTGPFRKYNQRSSPIFINRPMEFLSVNYEPFEQFGYRRTGPVDGGWETSQGQPLSFLFGKLLEPGKPVGSMGNYPSPDPVPVERLSRELTQRTWMKVDPSQASGLVSALEAHKSISLLTSKGRGLIALIDAAHVGRSNFLRVMKRYTGLDVRRRPIPKRVPIWDAHTGVVLTSRKGKPLAKYGHVNWVPRSSIVDPAAKLLLEYRYGWQIMIMEIIDGLKAFNAEALRNDLRLKFGSQYQVTRTAGETSYVRNTPLTGSLGGISYTGALVENTTVKCRTWVKWKLKEHELFRQLNDFGLFDVTRSMWDLIPLSFLIDMLADVSGYLQALDAYLKVNALETGHVIEIEQAFTRRLTSSNAATFNWMPICPIGTEERLTVVTKTRRPYLGLPSSPTVNVKATLYNVATVAALFKSKTPELRRLRV